QLSHLMGVQLGDPSIIFFARTDRGIQFVVIGNVVTVQTSLARLKIGRSVGITYPELVQIRHYLARLRKRKLPVELQPVSATGNARMFFCHVERSRDISHCVAVSQSQTARDSSTALGMTKATSFRVLESQANPGRAAK